MSKGAGTTRSTSWRDKGASFIANNDSFNIELSDVFNKKTSISARREIVKKIQQRFPDIYSDNELLDHELEKMGTVKNVSLSNLYPTQYTVAQGKMERLFDDVYTNGIKKPPLVVIHNGKFYLLNGHHRAASAKLAGKRKIRAYVIDGSKL